MGVKDFLVHFWVLSAAVQTRQASPVLSVSPNVTAKCGQSVTLHCNVSSDQDNLIVHHLSWINNLTTLCQHPSKGKLDDEGVQCRYTDKSLSVTFLQHSPQHGRTSDEYICKVRSNQDGATARTWVGLQECVQRGDAYKDTEGPGCIFRGVLPDREVHWYQGDTRLTEIDAVFNTRERLEPECCLTVISSLQPKNHTGPYTCSLWNSKSKTYTSTHAIPLTLGLIDPTPTSGMQGPRWSIGNCLIISVLLMLL